MQIETNIGRGDYKLVSPLEETIKHTKQLGVGGASLNAARAIKNTDAHKILRAALKKGERVNEHAGYHLQ
jgi:hypothetical protein